MHRTCMANPQLTKACCNGCSWDKEVLLKSCFNWPQPCACDRNNITKYLGPLLSQYAISRTPETVDDLKHTWTPLRTMLLGTVNPSHVPEGCQETQYNLKPAWQIKANAWNMHGKSTIDKSMQLLLLGQRGIAQKLLQLASTSCVWQEQNPSTKGTTYLSMPFQGHLRPWMTWNTLGHHFEPCSLEQSTQVMCLQGVKKHSTTSKQTWQIKANASQMHGKSTIDKCMQWLLLGQRGIAQKLLQLASTSCVWQEQNPSTKCAGPTYLSMPFQGHLRPWMTRNTLAHHFEPCSLEQSTQVMCLKGVKNHTTT